MAPDEKKRARRTSSFLRDWLRRRAVHVCDPRVPRRTPRRRSYVTSKGAAPEITNARWKSPTTPEGSLGCVQGARRKRARRDAGGDALSWLVVGLQHHKLRFSVPHGRPTRLFARRRRPRIRTLQLQRDVGAKPRKVQRLAELLDKGTLRVPIQRRYRLAEASEALRDLATGRTAWQARNRYHVNVNGSSSTTSPHGS